MRVDDLALLIESLAATLEDGLKRSSKQELLAAAATLRRFSGQTIKEFASFVDNALIGDRNSVPALLDRIRAFQAGNGESAIDLTASVKQLKAPDAKKLVQLLGSSPGRTVQENRDRIVSMLQDGRGPSAVTGDQTRLQVQECLQAYRNIEEKLSELSIAEIRQRFDPIGKRQKSVLSGVLSKLGYSIDGTRQELSNFLLSILERRKVGIEQTSVI